MSAGEQHPEAAGVLTTFGVIAPQLAENGYRPVPIKNGTKRPPMDGWPAFRVDDAALSEYRQCGTGLLCGELVGLDIDVLHERAAAELLDLARVELGGGPCRVGKAPKSLRAYRTTSPFRKKQTNVFLIDGQTAKVEALASGQQFVAFAQHPETRAPYRWPDGDPLAIPFAALPEVSEDQVAAFIVKAEAVLARYGKPQKAERKNGGDPPREHHQPEDDPARRAYAEAALAGEVKAVATTSRGSRNAVLNIAALKLGQLVATGWLDQNRVERSLEDAAFACGLVRDDELASVRATIRSGLDSGMREPRDPPERQADRYRGNGSGRKEEGEAQPGQQKEAGSPPTTEDAIALAFAKVHADTLRYVDAWSRWLRWDGQVWAHDETLGVFDLVRRQCREARKALPPGADKLHAILASAKTVAAVERLAKSDRRLAATVDQWDRDPDVLNTPGGVVDLRTGEIRPHASADYCTKITAVAPAPPGTDCPLWRAFLDRTMAGDGELIRFLQRVAGYALTGSTVEHALFFLYGTGANGKGVLLNTLDRHLRRLRDDRRDGNLHRQQQRASPDRPGDATRRPTGERAGNRRGPALGRGQDQVVDRRRSDQRPIYANGFLHLYAAVQAADRRQPQARSTGRRRSDPTAAQPHSVRRDYPAS